MIRKYHNQKVSEYDQEIPQSHTAAQPTTRWPLPWHQDEWSLEQR